VELLKSKNVLLEICPMSNYLTNCVESMEAHPVRRLLDAGNALHIIDGLGEICKPNACYCAGVKVSINSDDAGMFGTTLLDDYAAVNKHHKFSLEDFRSANLAALEASFLPQEVKASVRQKYFSN
jgi:adenosine deaminase